MEDHARVQHPNLFTITHPENVPSAPCTSSVIMKCLQAGWVLFPHPIPPYAARHSLVSPDGGRGRYVVNSLGSRRLSHPPTHHYQHGNTGSSIPPSYHPYPPTMCASPLLLPVHESSRPETRQGTSFPGRATVMTRIACSRASSDISVYYVSPLVGLGESFFLSLVSRLPLDRWLG